MSDQDDGRFYVGELADGRFAAASADAPYFCFRADSEEAVLKKVQGALKVYAQYKGIGTNVKLKSVSQTVTKLRPTKKYHFSDVANLVAA